MLLFLLLISLFLTCFFQFGAHPSFFPDDTPILIPIPPSPSPPPSLPALVPDSSGYSPSSPHPYGPLSPVSPHISPVPSPVDLNHSLNYANLPPYEDTPTPSPVLSSLDVDMLDDPDVEFVSERDLPLFDLLDLTCGGARSYLQFVIHRRKLRNEVIDLCARCRAYVRELEDEMLVRFSSAAYRVCCSFLFCLSLFVDITHWFPLFFLRVGDSLC